MDLEKELARLQDDLATVDLTSRRSDPAIIEFLIKRYQKIAIRMDTNQNHQRPHIHIDYGKDWHSASYAIDTGERLAGNLAHKYDQGIRKWIDTNRDGLNDIWKLAPTGADVKPLIAKLEGDGFT